MGTTFVNIGDNGFWMRDGLLEVWLRLLALHVEDPLDVDSPAHAIRTQWLLASRGCFNGCIPHGLDDAVATSQGRRIVLAAIESLTEALRRSPPTLDVRTLNLMGFEGSTFNDDLETRRLSEIGEAFVNLIEGRITSHASDTTFMPGSR